MESIKCFNTEDANSVKISEYGELFKTVDVQSRGTLQHGKASIQARD